MHHEIFYIFLIFPSFFLISWSTIFFLYYHMGQIDFDIADTSSTKDAFHI